MLKGQLLKPCIVEVNLVHSQVHTLFVLNLRESTRPTIGTQVCHFPDEIRSLYRFSVSPSIE